MGKYIQSGQETAIPYLVPVFVGEVKNLPCLFTAEEGQPIALARNIVELETEDAAAVRWLRQFDWRLVRVLDGNQKVFGIEPPLACLALRQDEKFPGRFVLSFSQLFSVGGHK